MATSSSKKPPSQMCLLCDHVGYHTAECPKYNTYELRVCRLQERRICAIYLEAGHDRTKCTGKTLCPKCKKDGHTYILCLQNPTMTRDQTSHSFPPKAKTGRVGSPSLPTVHAQEHILGQTTPALPSNLNELLIMYQNATEVAIQSRIALTEVLEKVVPDLEQASLMLGNAATHARAIAQNHIQLAQTCETRKAVMDERIAYWKNSQFFESRLALFQAARNKQQLTKENTTTKK